MRFTVASLYTLPLLVLKSSETASDANRTAKIRVPQYFTRRDSAVFRLHTATTKCYGLPFMTKFGITQCLFNRWLCIFVDRLPMGHDKAVEVPLQQCLHRTVKRLSVTDGH